MKSPATKQIRQSRAGYIEAGAVDSLDFDTSLPDINWDELDCVVGSRGDSTTTLAISPVLRRKTRRPCVSVCRVVNSTQSSLNSCANADDERPSRSTDVAAAAAVAVSADVNTASDSQCSLPFERSPRADPVATVDVHLPPSPAASIAEDLTCSLPLATPRARRPPPALPQQPQQLASPVPTSQLDDTRLTLSQLRRRQLLRRLSSPTAAAAAAAAVNASATVDASQFNLCCADSAGHRQQTADSAHGPFYGLPTCVAALLEKQRGIRQLYAWQEECLRLEAVTRRHNLVYSLPTSGGKTLVAELLIMRELVCRRRDCVFVLPYVAIVQEKVRSLAPFAIALGFIVAEYAAGRGSYPPPRRKKRRTVYVCTIEKAAALLVSLLQQQQQQQQQQPVPGLVAGASQPTTGSRSRAADELGLVVIDELHMLADGARGATLEQTIVLLKHATPDVQLVGMSATIGNMRELCTFMAATDYSRHFRPVQLREYVLLDGQQLLVAPETAAGGGGGDGRNDGDTSPLRPVRQVQFSQYTSELLRADPDRVGGLVAEVVPEHSCLVFCPTKNNCQAVALLVCRVLSRGLLEHNADGKRALYRALQQEGGGQVCNVLTATLPYGVAYHHSGLTSDERRLLEEAYQEGTLCCLCCTSTLAAGVNLPAKRVIIRSPYTGGVFLTRARYKQMAGRAGRAGIDDSGESLLIVPPADAKKVGELLTSPVERCCSCLCDNGHSGLRRLVVTVLTLQLVNSPRQLRQLLDSTLLAVDGRSQVVCLDSALVDVVQSLLNDRLLEVASSGGDTAPYIVDSAGGSVAWSSQCRLVVSRLGQAAVKGSIELSLVGRLYDDLRDAQTTLSLRTYLHLLYLVTPYDMMADVQPQPHIFIDMYSALDGDDVSVAQIIGVSERQLVKLMSGAPASPVVHRFYLTLILHQLLHSAVDQCASPVGGGRDAVCLWRAADRLRVRRGQLQQLVATAAAFGSCVLHFSQQLNELWPFAQLLEPLCRRLAVGCTAELLELMQLPAVKLGRARCLFAAGYTSLQALANAAPGDLVSLLDHMPRRVAKQVVDSAKMLVLERAEALQEEADFILDGLRSVEFHESPGLEQLLLSGVNEPPTLAGDPATGHQC